MPDHNESKQDLMAAIRRERAKLDELLVSFDDDAMLQPARDDGWTPKDIVAHLTAWEQRVLRWMERWRETGDPGRPEIGVTWEDMDPLNEREYEEARERPLADVRREAEESYAQILSIGEKISHEELHAKPEADDGPSWAWIIGANTAGHYEEHREEMEAFQ